MNEPNRMSNADDSVLRSMLRSADDDGPSSEAVARLSGRLAAALPPGALVPRGAAPTSPQPPQAPTTQPPTTTGAAATKLALVKLGAAFVMGATVGAIGHSVATTKAGPTIAATPSASASTVSSALEVVSAAPVTPVEDLPLAPVPTAPGTTTRANAPSSSASVAPAASENELLDRAHAALLHRDAAKALALTDAHARAYPKGVLAEERELIAIEALVALGRKDAARSRADAFRAAYPGSGYGARLDAILGAP